MFTSFHQIGLHVLERPVEAFQADKYKKHYKTHSEILTLVNMSIENVESPRDLAMGKISALSFFSRSTYGDTIQ